MSSTYLLLDGALVLHHLTRNLRLRVHPAEKDADHGVLLREEYFAELPKRWEARFDNGYPTVLRDPGTGLLRLYYTLFSTDPSSVGATLAERPGLRYEPTTQRVTSVAVAESQDGVTWSKPPLGLVAFEGSRDNNLLMTHAHGTGVMLDPADPDPGRRYKLVTRAEPEGGRHGMAVAFSADGLHFGELKRWPEHDPRADTHTAPFRDPNTGRYGLTTRIWNDGVRICALSTSDDFLHWSEPTEVLRGPSYASQVYSMPVFVHHGQFIGLPTIYHEGDRDTPDFDLTYCGLATSHDLDSWQFVDPGQALIPRGDGRYPNGAFDCGTIYSSVPIDVDGQQWLYYMGSNGPHTGFRETSLGRARIDLDRLAGFSPVDPNRPGELVLGPFVIGADDVELLVDVRPGGVVSYELIEAPSRVSSTARIGAAPSTELRGSGWQPVALGGALAELGGREVYLSLSVTNAELFAVRGSMEHRRFR